jgi:chemotaxis protein MotB
MARKKHHVEHPDERWLLTYADMITLLMALFMVLFAMATVDQTKFQKLKVTLKDTFDSPVFDGGSSILDHGALQSSQSTPQSDLENQDTPLQGLSPGAQQKQQTSQGAASASAAAVNDAQLRRAQQRLLEAIRRQGLQRSAEVKIERRGLVIRLVTDKVLFDLGSWELRAAIEPLIDTVAQTVQPLPNVVHVEGYTDRLAYGGAPFGNDGLSFFRASAVLRALEREGFAVERHDAVAVGYGPRHPLVANDASGAAPRNRRVEIVLLRLGAAGGPDTAKPIGDDPVGVAIAP